MYTINMETDAKIAMVNLIKEIREKIPFKMSFYGFCEGRCDVCPEKLIEFLDIEVSHWESRIQHNVSPNEVDVENLAKDYQKIHVILEKQGLAK